MRQHDRRWSWKGVAGVAAMAVIVLVAAAGEAQLFRGKAAQPLVKIIPFLTNESDPASVKVFRDVIAEFERANPGVQVDLVLTAHGGETERVVTAHAVGADIGVVHVSNRDAADFAQAGYLLPLDDVVQAVGPTDFKPGALLKLDGKTWGIAYSGGTHATMWVRKDLFDEAKLPLPRTYAEFLAAAKALTRDKDNDGKIDVYGIGLPAGSTAATTLRFVSFVYQNCGDYFDKAGNLVFDRPQVLEAIKRYVALLQYSPPGHTGWHWFDGIDAFAAGKIAMHPYGGRLGVNLEKMAPQIRANTVVTWYPAGERVKAGRGSYDYLAISSTTKHPAEAKAFLRYFLTGDRLPRFLVSVPGHLIPPTNSAGKTLAAMDDAYVKKYRPDVEALFAAADFSADPAINMGAVDVNTCRFDPTFNPMPWAGPIFGRKPPIDAELLQRIVVRKESPEAAWQWAVAEMKKAVAAWKTENPDWKPGAGR